MSWGGLFLVVSLLFGRGLLFDSSGRSGSPRRKSYPSSFADTAGNAVRQGLHSTFTPQGPTPEELERERRRKAEQAYWFHQKAADRL